MSIATSLIPSSLACHHGLGDDETKENRLGAARVARGWDFLAADCHAVRSAFGVTAHVLHLPFGGVPGQEFRLDMPDVLLARGGDWAAWVTGFAPAIAKLTAEGFTVIAYLGSLQLSPTLARAGPAEWFRAVARNMAPVMDAGCDFAFDALADRSAISPEYHIAAAYRAKTGKGWCETLPDAYHPHFHDWPIYADDRVWRALRPRPEYAGVKLTGPVMRYVPLAPGWTVDTFRRDTLPAVRAVLADGHRCAVGLAEVARLAPDILRGIT